MKNEIMTNYIQAGACDTAAEDLSYLAKSRHAIVRRRVAENEESPEKVLRTLSKDRSAEVRMAVGLNKACPVDLIKNLSEDESPDVRYRIASTSYIPLTILKLLVKDTNPHVAKRAKETLSGLESEYEHAITIFEFMHAEHQMLIRGLRNLIKHYPQWSHDLVFDKTIKILDAIKLHLQRQEAWCHELMKDIVESDETSKHIYEESIRSCQELKDKMFNLLMQHVDGPDFQADLEVLLDSLEGHIQFLEKSLFTHIKRNLSEEDLASANENLEEVLIHKAMI